MPDIHVVIDDQGIETFPYDFLDPPDMQRKAKATGAHYQMASGYSASTYLPAFKDFTDQKGT